MYHFRIQFAYSWSPWLLLLLIPAICVPLFLYFRVAKRYRRTRNRIISLILHLTVMVLTVAAVAGITFTYQVDNPENEIILLVDVSDTQETVKEQRDEFVRTVLNESRYDGFRVGVVTFGFTQEYAVPLTYEADTIYDRYTSAELPDTSATDISAALRYTAELFENPLSSKIVLITDGKETDEQALSAVGAITARGIKIDTVYISSLNAADNFQVVGVDFPEYHVELNETCNIQVHIRSALDGELTVELYDNGQKDEENGTKTETVKAGPATLGFEHVFTESGLHEIEVRIASEDALQQNNKYYAYLYLDVYNRILILERYEGESEELENLLAEEEEGGYEIETKSILATEELPQTVDELRQYDQVILNNIANADFPEGFDEMLYSYVYTYGGGLFTVGGNDELTGEPHAYNRQDMADTLYQQMLPVQAINYTPPVGLVIVIDISGSMDMDGGNGITKRELAKQGAIACLDALTERDYVGIMTLDTVYGVVLPMTSLIHKAQITNAIEHIDGTGGTVFSDALFRAGQMLTDLRTVDRRHVIIVTDGVPTNSDEDNYLSAARQNYVNNEITLSVVGIGIDPGSDAESRMRRLVAEGGNAEDGFHFAGGKASDIAGDMYNDLLVPEIKEVIPEPFHPVVSNTMSPLMNGVECSTDSENKRTLAAQVGGFYGTKVRSDEYLVLQGEYEVPLYAQWKFGAGSVGSFMSDLSGNWSAEFLADANGQRFLRNVIANLMPTENIRPNEITVDLIEDNYLNEVNIFTDLGEGETLRGEIYDMATGESISLNEPSETSGDRCYTTFLLGAENGYSRCGFVVKQEGVYRITLTKYDAAGNPTETVFEMYKSFSFSEEYDLFAETGTEPAVMLGELAERGGGAKIEDPEAPWEIFENFQTRLDRGFDPRWVFMIAAIVLFLLDIAVRKFKFKWPHELYREYKQKKERRASDNGRVFGPKSAV